MKLFSHQEEALQIASQTPYLGLFWEMGTGKTRTIVEIISNKFRENKAPLKTLILCPQVCVENWADEFEMWSAFSRKNIVLPLSKSAGRLKTFVNEMHDKHIVITNYEALRTKAFFEQMCIWNPDIVIGDESQRFKNPKAQITKAVLKVSQETKFRYTLSGTMLTNSPLDLFSQCLFLDRGKAFGKNFFVYQATYMVNVNDSRKGLPNYFPMWKPRVNKFSELTDKLSKLGTRVVKSDVLDLPPLIKQAYKINLSPKQRKYYDQMKEDAVIALEEAESSGVSVGPIAITQTLRMQQIVSGFVMDDEKNVIDIDKSNERIKALKDLVKDILEQKEKVIIWTCFKHDVELIKKEFKKYGPAIIDGGTKNKDEELKRFRGRESSKDLQTTDVLIANRKAAGIGINLVEAKYSIVFSRNHSLEDELQSEARNYRRGSESHDRIVKIDLVARDTIDEEILKALKGKENMAKAIVDIIRR